MARMPLHGVVSLLDSKATERVKSTWARLGREFDLRGVLVMPFPHFSYQIAQRYDRTAIETTLTALAREIPPFTIRTKGLATFPGSWPVVYVAVEKDAALTSRHRRVWDQCLPHARDVSPYYRPDRWTPHITLAHGEERNSVPLPVEVAREVVEALSTEDYRWQTRIDNIALVWDEGELQKPVATFPLEGQGSDAALPW